MCSVTALAVGIVLFTDEGSKESAIGIPNRGIHIFPFERLVGKKSSLTLPATKVVEGLQNSNISTIGTVMLELAIDTTIMVFRNIHSQVELYIGESSLPRSNSWVSLANS
jgi:hypothetical protein